MVMQYTPESESAIMQMDTEELWQNFVDVCEEDPYVRVQHYEMVKSGFEINFDIRKFTNGYCKDRIEKNVVYIMGERIYYYYSDFYDEIDKRNSLMRRVILNHIRDDDIYKVEKEVYAKT